MHAVYNIEHEIVHVFPSFLHLDVDWVCMKDLACILGFAVFPGEVGCCLSLFFFW